MPEYRVTYEIDIDAESPQEAAEVVARLLLEDARHSIYEVAEHRGIGQSPGKPVLIDLQMVPAPAQDAEWLDFT